MVETHTAGLKEFIYAVVWVSLLFILGRYSEFVLPAFKVISVLFTILLFGLFAFFVLTRYCAVFTYTLKGNYIRVNRRIGHRNKEVEIKLSYIKSISQVNPRIRPTYRMKKYILKNKSDCYIVFENNNKTQCLLFAPSPQMLKKLNKSLKKNRDS